MFPRLQGFLRQGSFRGLPATRKRPPPPTPTPADSSASSAKANRPAAEATESRSQRVEDRAIQTCWAPSGDQIENYLRQRPCVIPRWLPWPSLVPLPSRPKHPCSPPPARAQLRRGAVAGAMLDALANADVGSPCFRSNEAGDTGILSEYIASLVQPRRWQARGK